MRLVKLLFTAFFLLTISGFGQGRIVIEDGAYITMSGGSAVTPIYMVVENPNANAITAPGISTGIVSEDEYNKVRWMIGNNTGTYRVPFYSAYNGTGMDIPWTLQLTSAGSAGAYFDFSSYRTVDNNLAEAPSMVTHMLDAATATVNNSLNVADRFYLADDNGTYATKPNVTMTIVYDNSAVEIGPGNTLVEANLVAQRFNSDLNAWEGDPSMTSLYFGTNNVPSRTVGPFNVPAADLYEAWVLVDRNNLLPIELLDFNAECQDQSVLLQWTTASETNNDHFTVERSTDGLVYTPIAMVQGAGNSSAISNYSYEDTDPLSEVSYYRISQTDFDGTTKAFDPIATQCEVSGIDIISGWQSAGEDLILQVAHDGDHAGTLQVFDARGRIVYEDQEPLMNGTQQIRIPGHRLGNGIYHIRITSPVGFDSFKTWIR